MATSARLGEDLFFECGLDDVSVVEKFKLSNCLLNYYSFHETHSP